MQSDGNENDGKLQSEGKDPHKSGNHTNYGRLASILQKQGFDFDDVQKALKIARQGLLKKGLSENQALKRISENVRRKGTIFQYLQKKQAERKGAAHQPPPGGPARESFEKSTCPKCGFPREPNQSECPNCGVIFSKIKAPASRASEASSDQAGGSGGGIEEASGTGGIQDFLRRHKKLSAAAVCALGIFILAAVGQWYFTEEFESAEQTFRQNLSMETKEAFEASLENLYRFFDVAASTVSKHGWSYEDVTGFCDTVRDCRKTFLDMMNQRAQGKESLYGHSCEKLSACLCGGLKYVLANIEDDDVREQIAFQYSLHGLLSGKGCDVSTFANAKKELLNRKSTEKAGGSPDDKSSGSRSADRDLGEQYIMNMVRRDLRACQRGYKQRHGVYCDDPRELVRESRKHGPKVSAITEEMVETGNIVIELTDDGYHIRKFRHSEIQRRNREKVRKIIEERRRKHREMEQSNY